MLAIVFLIAALLASAVFGTGGDNRIVSAPVVNLQTGEFNTSVLTIEHLGGDPLEFDSSKTSVILNVAGNDHLLESSNLGVLKVGDAKLLFLKDREGNLIYISSGALVTLKIIDLASDKPVSIQKIRFRDSTELSEKYQPGIVGYYYLGNSFSGPAVKHTDYRLRFAEKTYNAANIYGSDLDNWPTGIINITDLKNETFSVKYEGFIKVEEASQYTFTLRSDDWAQLYINGNLVIEDPHPYGHNAIFPRNAILNLSAGYHPTMVEFKENKGTSVLQLKWASPSLSECYVEDFYHLAS